MRAIEIQPVKDRRIKNIMKKRRMMMKRFILLSILLAVLFTACDNKDKAGEKLVRCPGKPLKGIVKLNLEKTLEIDSLSLDSEKPPLFEFLAKDGDGNIYIGSNRPEPKVFKFNSSGFFLKKFLTKGEGPGEVLSIHTLQYIDKSIMVSSNTKTAEYDLDGNYVAEKRFKKMYGNIIFIDNQHFIANYFKADKNNKSLDRLCSIINLSSEAVTAELFRSDRESIGNTNIKDSDGKIRFTVALSGITPDYKSIFSREDNLIIQCLTDEAKIYIKNRQGYLINIVDSGFQSKILDENDRDDVLNNFVGFPDDLKNMVRKNLPQKILAISSLKVIPKGHFAVYFNKNLSEHEIWVFDKDGRFQYIFDFPGKTSIRPSSFTKNGFMAIERSGDRDFYIEYKIKNMPEIFF